MKKPDSRNLGWLLSIHSKLCSLQVDVVGFPKPAKQFWIEGFLAGDAELIDVAGGWKKFNVDESSASDSTL